MTETDQPQIPRGELLKQISNAMVGIKKNLYGKGPVKAKTFINDNFVFVVLEGGLTQNEITLLDAGEAEMVRIYRLRSRRWSRTKRTSRSRSSPAARCSPTTARSCSTRIARSRYSC